MMSAVIADALFERDRIGTADELLERSLVLRLGLGAAHHLSTEGLQLTVTRDLGIPARPANAMRPDDTHGNTITAELDGHEEIATGALHVPGALGRDDGEVKQIVQKPLLAFAQGI